MVEKKAVIETGVDKLVRLVNERGKVSVPDAAKELGVPVASIEEWADFLEDEGIISIQRRLATVYLEGKRLSKQELVEKVKAVKEEKEEFLKRVESSINALERDNEEVKLINSEFRRMNSLLKENFSRLCSKLDRIRDYRKAHQDMERRHKELEEGHEKKLKGMESRIKAEQAEYSRVLAAVTEEAERLRKEKEEVSGLKDVEKQLLSKVGEINDMVEKVRGELKRGNEQLAADEKRLLASEETAKHIKRDIESSSKELEELSKGMKESYKELEAMEKEFAANLECLSKGELEKIGAYSEGRQLAEKFRAFFSKTREIEGMIARAEKEEGELKRHFDALVRKARAFSVVASMPDVKKEIASLQGELMAAEERKSALSAQLKKLRGLVRSVVS